MYKKVSIIAILFLMIMVSCKKDVVVIPENSAGVEQMDELQINPNFNWSTDNTYELTITGFTRGLLEIQGSNNTVYHRSFIQKRQAEVIKVTVASYEKTLTLKLKGETATINLNSNQISFVFNK